jgi:hypothetical protein
VAYDLITLITSNRFLYVMQKRAGGKKDEGSDDSNAGPSYKRCGTRNHNQASCRNLLFTDINCLKKKRLKRCSLKRKKVF